MWHTIELFARLLRDVTRALPYSTMCGIAGYLRFERDLHVRDLQQIVERMASEMVHRGPDDGDVWVDPAGCGALAHRRLSIIDTSSAGRQPMSSADGGVFLVFNGEIYNYQELWSRLEAAGCTFRTRTDSEVLLESLRCWGTDAFPQLDGMYAFGLLETKSAELLLGRDPFGEKPLYYIATPRFFAFASELHALQTVPGFDDTVELGALAEYCCLQYVDAPRSLYRGVQKLPPGHYLRVDRRGTVTLNRHFAFEPGAENDGGDRSIDDLADELEELLVRSIRRRLIADVPLGAFLSGGIDSSLVVALITRRLGLPIRTFSIGFEGTDTSEHFAARKVAQRLGAIHEDKVLGPDTAALLLEVGARMDEPNGDASCMPTFLLSEFTRQHVTVAISGDGGDELFGGYNRYTAALRAARSSPVREAAPGEMYYSGLALLFTEHQIRELFGFVPRSLRSLLAELCREVDWSDAPLLARLRSTDARHYLPGAVLAKVDRMSMQHSLEVRTPYLNREIARFAEGLPEELLIDGDRSKVLLRHLAARYLAQETVTAPKQGFGLPMRRAWDGKTFVQQLEELVRASDSPLRTCFGEQALARFLTRQKSEVNLFQVSAMITLETYLRRRPATLPDPGRRAPLAELQTPGVESASVGPMLLHLRKRGASVDLYCDEFVPDWVGDLPAGSRLVTPLPVGGDSVSAVCWDWRETTARIPDALQRQHGTRSEDSVVVLFGRDASYPIEPRLFEQLERGRAREVLCVDGEHWRSFRLTPEALERRQQSRGRRQVGAAIMAGFLLLSGARRGGRRSLLRRIALLPLAVAWRLARETAGALPLSLTEFLPRPLHRFSGFKHTQGYAFQARYTARVSVRDRDLSDRFLVFESGIPLKHPGAHKRDVRQLGRGHYTVMNRNVYFATSDNTDPNENGRSYCLLPRSSRRGRWWQLLFRNFAVCDLPALRSFGEERPEEGRWLEGVADHFRRTDVSRQTAVAQGCRPGSIAIITNGLGPGGTERQVTSLAVELADRGHAVSVIALEPPRNRYAHYLSRLHSRSIPVYSPSMHPEVANVSQVLNASEESLRLLSAAPPRVMPMLWKLFLLLARIGPEYVHCQLDVANVQGGIAAGLLGVPHILLSVRSLNPTRATEKLAWCNQYYRALCASSRVVLSANSRAGIEDYARWLGIDPGQFVLIRNGFSGDPGGAPPTGVVERLRRELGLLSGGPVVLTVQRLSREKQPLLFVEAVALLRRTQPALRAFLVGDGPLAGEVEARVKQLRLDGVLQLLGRRKDVSALMSLADVVLLTSRIEGTPNVLLEAQHLGIPVVTTDAGGAREAVIDGVTGHVCATNTAAELAHQCQRILSDEPGRREMGQAGHRFVEESYRMECCVAKTLEALCFGAIRA